ncbi:MAG: DUF2442 domain-containing protein [Chloroflexales bacterium]|nr:DUF2442 domain-containing protein [Chloroflexales bacterium]
MPTPIEPAMSLEATLDRLAEQYVWGHADIGATLAEQICALLGREDDEDFDLDAWAVDRVERLRGDPDLLWENGSLAVRAGEQVGLPAGQWWNARHELITALQLHPGERLVLVEDGIEEVARAELVEMMRTEITATLTRARFLGLDAMTVRLLCEEGVATSDVQDYEALWDAVRATPTLGDGEGVRHLVRIISVELLDGYRVRLQFDDGVGRVLDLDPILRGPGRAAIRRSAFFVQMRVEGGTIRWPNGVALDPIALRYAPAVGPNGAEA